MLAVGRNGFSPFPVRFGSGLVLKKARQSWPWEETRESREAFFFFFFVVFAAAAPLADDAHSFGWTRRGGTLRGVLFCFLFIDLLQFDVYVGGARELFMPKPTEHLF